jgi:SAM-dependent methyltransferase
VRAAPEQELIAARLDRLVGSRDGSGEGLLRCQQTLAPLRDEPSGFASEAADLLYPSRNGLVFMGYDHRDADFVARVIAEERTHQTSAEHVDRDLAFLRDSAPAVVDVINLLSTRKLVRRGALGLEIGAASGWPAWLFAEAGCEMWLCELEPNSLASGLAFEHPNIGEGHRIVCDASFLPFGDATFDLVLCKELLHHMRDKTELLAEANRVLKPDGVLVLFEPVRSLQSTVSELRRPDPHFGHAIEWPRGYLRAVRASGFDALVETNYHTRVTGRFRLIRRLRRRSRERLRRGEANLDLRSRGFMGLCGGSLVVVARKQAAVGARPAVKIAVTQPEDETWTTGDAYDRSPFVEELRHAAKRLRPTTSG